MRIHFRSYTGKCLNISISYSSLSFPHTVTSSESSFLPPQSHPSGFPGGLAMKNLPAVQETRVQSLHQEDPLEEQMATHSSILAWRIPWTGRLAGYSPGFTKSQMSEHACTSFYQHKHFFNAMDPAYPAYFVSQGFSKRVFTSGKCLTVPISHKIVPEISLFPHLNYSLLYPEMA